MNLLIDPETINDFNSNDLIPLECKFCASTFLIKKVFVYTALYGTTNSTLDFCSLNCKQLESRKKIEVKCMQCNVDFQKLPSQIKVTKNNFCTKSCAAIYNNTHKTHGIRRSKLEVYIEEQIRIAFPTLELVCNAKNIIGSELDFYFPSLRLAIELNGILHYEPIYGQDKLERICNMDQQKSIGCFQKNIEFCIIDTSQCKYLTQIQKDKYWKIVYDLLIQLERRSE